MEKINRFFAGVAEACHPSKGSFSGAMDVIVIRRSDGTLASTPFYVKFGRFKLVKSNNTVVYLHVNGVKTPIQMVLLKSGRAIFVHAPVDNRPREETKNESSDPDILISDEEEPVRDVEESFDSAMAVEEIKGERKFERKRSYRQNIDLLTSKNNLNSRELESLNLSHDINVVQYVTETKNKVNLHGRIYFWNDFDKIVISDIDGTLTKSDMMGHLCYLIGRDWSRAGVVNLYNDIASKNYKILYLSSRSISQVDSTRNLLNFMDQSGQKLPHGPILLSPDGTFRSIIREISNYSQELKDRLLTELIQTFPIDKQPFWAGFGNRNGDAVAYFRAGIPPSRIFILSNKKKKEECSLIKNFNEISLNFDEHFPVVNN